MRACVTLAALLLALPAAAADPGDTVFAKAVTPSTRFPDAEDKGPTFGKDAALTVVFVEGDRLRVRGENDGFGWVSADAVTDLAPERDAGRLDAALEDLDLSGFDLGGGDPGAAP